MLLDRTQLFKILEVVKYYKRIYQHFLPEFHAIEIILANLEIYQASYDFTNR